MSLSAIPRCSLHGADREMLMPAANVRDGLLVAAVSVSFEARDGNE